MSENKETKKEVTNKKGSNKRADSGTFERNRNGTGLYCKWNQHIVQCYE